MHSAPWAGVLATGGRLVGCQDRQASLGLSDRRTDCGQPSVVHRGRPAEPSPPIACCMCSHCKGGLGVVKSVAPVQCSSKWFQWDLGTSPGRYTSRHVLQIARRLRMCRNSGVGDDSELKFRPRGLIPPCSGV